MTRTPSLLPIALSALLAVACTVGGGIEPGTGGNPAEPDAGGGAEPTPDAGDVPQAADLTGSVNDWYLGTPLAGVSLESDDMTPPMTATSAPDGSYELDGLTPDVLFDIQATMAQPGYRVTLNPAMKYAGTPLAYDLHVAAEADVQKQYDAAGVAMIAGTSFVVAELLKGDGTGRDGVLAADITLTDGLGAPVGEGPYFFGALGDIDLAILQSEIHQGKARIAFLNVPPGTYTLTAIYPQNNDGQNGGGDPNKTASVITITDGASLIRVNDKAVAGAGAGGGQ